MKELLIFSEPAKPVFSGMADVQPDVMRLIQATETSRVDELLEPTPKEVALATGDIPISEYVRPEDKIILDNGENVHCRFGYHSQKERAAYLVDKTIKFGLVPTSVMRNMTTRFGSQEVMNVQEDIPNGKIVKNRLAGEEIDTKDLPHDELYRVWILDYCIWNTDPGKHNLILTPEDHKLHAFDHPNAFADDQERVSHRGFFVDFYGVQAPKDVIEEANAFLEDELLRDGLLNELKGLVRESEAEACLARMKHIFRILAAEGKIDAKTELQNFFPE
jgi:hypothetical protein